MHCFWRENVAHLQFARPIILTASHSANPFSILIHHSSLALHSPRNHFLPWSIVSEPRVHTLISFFPVRFFRPIRLCENREFTCFKYSWLDGKYPWRLTLIQICFQKQYYNYFFTDCSTDYQDSVYHPLTVTQSNRIIVK